MKNEKLRIISIANSLRLKKYSDKSFSQTCWLQAGFRRVNSDLPTGRQVSAENLQHNIHLVHNSKIKPSIPN
jgi:hypothetical protein